ncbi:MAG: chemotaxis response regulator protein-glutamate methylesterase [Nitrospiraceae bacterium]|jgi:two-component system chemotaxis response regulator CheB|uniref:protein-glutamate methylesterase/protein-glutamine glutaminase n=1 Tax=Nitrospira cf. moscoviensis SBR1015 TaxID=96242 RepID=UPI000A0A0A20|nr:chemotaxis response regulator protein-glutamate methylesterase [Nitrospira cf. moscoviensis SBR1015]MBY0246624.1 chemotaxis response regulator protein-glutamate methylesterase [Nitrospiraceae bacterium]OQW31953.1 MAG: chemotaxis response regulator protein-glutamate methylesterase [Nitrospira sp. SG-bin2]
MGKIRVLIVDDSALMRQVLTALLSKDPDVEVIGVAPDPYAAREKIKALNPDVLTLDVEMPKMDGLTFLEKLMRGHPMPVVMVSSLTEAGCQTTLRALELGAVDFITKPKIDLREGMEELAQDIIAKVKAAAVATVKRQASGVRREMPPLTPHPSPLTSRGAMIKTTDTIIAIGSSTGGTEAVKEVLEVLPPNTPPILITQHMPERFTKTWADRLNGLCRISVKEAVDGDSVLPGHALIAPGSYHMTLVRSGARYTVQINQDPPVNRHRPSVDVMFASVAQYAGGNAVGVILTGMGGDGAKGLLVMKQAGAFTIAQDEASCVVFGMPKEAIKLGGAERVLPLADIASAIYTHVNR